MRLVIVPAEEFGRGSLAALRELLAGVETPVIALPTGNTPVSLYEEMVGQQYTFAPGVRLFALDEYFYPRAHSGTNAAFFDRHLPPGQFPPIARAPFDAENPGAEIGRVCQDLRQAGGLDLVVLGIGVNGHLGFNEPGSTLESPCRVVELAAETQSQVAGHWQPTPTRGVTLGMDELLAARSVLLLANGMGKAAILAAALNGPETPGVPASFLQRHPGVVVVCDTAAAAALSAVRQRATPTGRQRSRFKF